MLVRRITLVLLPIAMSLAVMGCAEKNTPVPGPSQDALAAQQRATELEQQLNQAMANSARDRDRIRALENELASLRKQLAQRPEPAAAPAPGWSTVSWRRHDLD